MLKLSSHPLAGRSPRRRISPLMLIGMSLPLLLLLITGIIFVAPRVNTHAANNVNGDCSLIVPPNPLSAQGLATPYQLIASNPDKGPCHESNANQSAFVQGAVIDPATGQVSIYDPLVIDKGSHPAIAPTVPQLPANGIVALWFGFNGNNLTLKSKNGSLGQGQCVNGANGSIFGQFAYCNAPAFFNAANQAIQAGQLKVPAIGTANDGMPCMTVRNFGLVDMDQSDNVTTAYLITGNGKVAQMTAANIADLNNAQMQVNGSDNRLLAIAMDGAQGCQPWMAPDLADNGNMTTALPLDELQAAAQQAPPVALVPVGDPMVLNNGNQDLGKIDAYRQGVDQPAVDAIDNASTKMYCSNMLNIAPARIQLDAQTLKGRPSPDPAAANTLFTFMAQRFNASFGANGLNCTGLLNQPNPIKLTTDNNGVVVDASITVPNGGNMGNQNGLSCVINGNTVAGCNGTTMINGQSCTFTLDQANQRVNIQCQASQKQQNGGQNQ